MRHALIISLAATALLATACSKAEQADAKHDTQAAIDKTAADAKALANGPEVEGVKSDVKGAAADAKVAAQDMAAQAKDAVKDTAADAKVAVKDAAADAKQSVHEATAPDKKSY